MVDAVSVENVSKVFRLYQEKYTTLKERVIHLGNVPFDEFKALDDVSFSVPRGTTFGLLGHNGSGKSTLLKCIAGILRPSSGRIVVRGQVASILEIGAGFNPELSGRDNIYLNATLLGMKRREIDRRFDSIVEFSELERYIDNQVKFYSTGMYAKLGFAVAVSFEPDVLLVDEVLAVGDERFQAKCLARIREFQEDGRTIIIVSHAPDVMRSLCDQVAVLDHGRMVALGPAAHSVQAFRHLLFGITPADETQEVDGAGWSKTVTLQIGQVRVEHPAMAERAHLLPREPMVVVVPFTAGGEIDGLLFSVAIYDSRGQLMHMIDTAGQGPMRVGRSGELFFSFEDVPLLEGTYTISVRAVRAADGRPLDLKETAASFDVVSPSRAQGVVHMPSSVELRAGRPSVAASA